MNERLPSPYIVFLKVTQLVNTTPLPINLYFTKSPPLIYQTMLFLRAQPKSISSIPHLHFPLHVNYVAFKAQVRSVHEHSIPWIVIDPILRPNEPIPQLQIGSNIELIDTERSLRNEVRWGREPSEAYVSRRGELKYVLSMEKGYVIFIMEAHQQGHEDIYGSHHLKLRVAIPLELVRLNIFTRFYYHIKFPHLDCSMGQTISHHHVIQPPRRSFTNSPFVQRTLE